MPRTRRVYRTPWSEAASLAGGETVLRDLAKSDSARSEWKTLGVPADVLMPLVLKREPGEAMSPADPPRLIRMLQTIRDLYPDPEIRVALEHNLRVFVRALEGGTTTRVMPMRKVVGEEGAGSAPAMIDPTRHGRVARSPGIGVRGQGRTRPSQSKKYGKTSE